MKRILALLVGIGLMASLTACGGKEISNDKITISKYKGLEVTAVENAEVTEEDLELSIQSTLEAYAAREEITDRPAKDGDVVVIDYCGTLDGVAFDGGTADDTELELGSDSFIDGFEDGIIGHNIGETFDLNLTFPEEYHSEDLAGKEVVFGVTLDAIYEIVIPELTDEFVQSVSETSTTVEEYKEEMKASLQLSNEESAQAQLEQFVWAELIKNCTVKNYPEDEMEAIYSDLELQYGYYASMYGVETSEFVQEMFGVTMEEMAKEIICQRYAIELISEVEEITITLEEYEEGLANYAYQYGYDDPAEFEEAVGEETVKDVLKQEKVAEIIISNCVQVEKDAVEE